MDIQAKDKEENLYAVKKDIENQQYTNSNMRADLNDYLAEKDALERHSRILLGQNDDLTKELERFVNTDEVLRQQLDRRGRVITMQEQNNRELQHSNYKIVEARSRSPAKDRSYQHQSTNSYQRSPVKGSSYHQPSPGASAGAGNSYIRGTRGGSPLRSSYRKTYNY